MTGDSGFRRARAAIVPLRFTLASMDDLGLTVVYDLSTDLRLIIRHLFLLSAWPEVVASTKGRRSVRSRCCGLRRLRPNGTVKTKVPCKRVYDLSNSKCISNTVQAELVELAAVQKRSLMLTPSDTSSISCHVRGGLFRLVGAESVTYKESVSRVIDRRFASFSQHVIHVRAQTMPQHVSFIWPLTCNIHVLDAL